MYIIKENRINESNFRWNAVKNVQVSGTKARITIEVDLAEAIKGLRYDLRCYGITQGQLNYEYLSKVIASQLDWQAYALSTNDGHDLARILADV